MSQIKSSQKLELLTSWKEIANFMGKGVRTVQRWEATLGLPVIRPSDSRSGIVMARPGDLEAWVLSGRHLPRNHDGRGQDVELHATFSECVRELHRYHAEVRELCSQMNATRQSLRQEIDRLKFLYGEWDAIRDRAQRGEDNLGEDNNARAAKVN